LNFLLAYRTFIHKTKDTLLASIVFGKKLHLLCKLLFGGSPKQEAKYN
jgi:hypothetical protein